MSATTQLEALVARSRSIGARRDWVVHGGGNTSAKGPERDHLGRRRRVLRVKGSGTDLATIGPDGFPGLFLDELEPLREHAAMADEEMVEHLRHAATEPGGRTPSVEALLHAFVAAPHVDHVHADAICALTNHTEGRAAVAAALGADVAYVPYLRPGFALSRQVADADGAAGAVLEHHGLVTWGATGESSLERTAELVRAAEAHLRERGADLDEPGPVPPRLDDAALRELLARLRARLGGHGPQVLHVDTTQRALADRDDVARLCEVRGTPDHVLRIGARTALVRGVDDVDDVVDAFVAEHDAYVARHRAALPAGLAPPGPLPRVVLAPGLGCVGAGRTAAAARVATDLAGRSHRVSALALDAFGDVDWLSEAEVFAFDTWPLELRKLALAPPPPPSAGRVAAVALADPALSRAVADALAGRGAEVVLVPDDGEGAGFVHDAALRFGGVDVLVVDAGDEEAARDWTAPDGGAPGARVVGVAVGPGEEDVDGSLRRLEVGSALADPGGVATSVAFLAECDGPATLQVGHRGGTR